MRRIPGSRAIWRLARCQRGTTTTRCNRVPWHFIGGLQDNIKMYSNHDTQKLETKRIYGHCTTTGPIKALSRVYASLALLVLMVTFV